MKKIDENYNVPGLEKGLMIMELLSNSDRGLTMIDITSRIDVTVTTAYRILSTLLRLGYVNYYENGKSYKLTRKMLCLGYRTIGEHDLMEMVLPAIRELRDKVKESVFFGVLGEDKGVFIEQAPSIYPFKFVLSAGTSFDLHNSAPGKAIMAFSSSSVTDRYLKKIDFTRCTKNTITTRTAYLKELDAVRKSGYSIDNEESLLGVSCIGAPLLNYEFEPVGAIWVSGPSSRLCDDTFEVTVKELLDTTGKLSKELGYK